MTFAVYLPAALSLLLVAVSRAAARHTSPAAVTRGLALAAAGTAIAYAACLSFLALTLLDDLPPLAAFDHLPGLPRPVPGPIALAAAGLLGWSAWRLLRDLRIRRDTHRRLRSVGSPDAGGLVVADWAAPHAVAVPGRPGHVLITTGLLRTLDGRERAVVLAHEQAHLRHGHHRFTAVAAAAAAVNPLLAPLRDAVAHHAERWADEEAASQVGDRGLVARCVAKAALAATPVLGLGGASVVGRVRALRSPAPDGRWTRLAGPAAIVAMIAAVTATAAVEFAAVASAWLHAV
ncbi:M56 family metallopeptidase [Asanoa sp. NPDC050611]|uniref:M56 family metallopeptidase n=1 Tax=Asanoa sp. NPDC050611 TaxID=3157098 RepID=UPI0033F64EF8